MARLIVRDRHGMMAVPECVCVKMEQQDTTDAVKGQCSQVDMDIVTNRKIITPRCRFTLKSVIAT